MFRIGARTARVLALAVVLSAVGACSDRGSPIAPGSDYGPLPAVDRGGAATGGAAAEFLLPEPDAGAIAAILATRSQAGGPAAAPARRFPVVLVHPQGTAPGQRGAPVVNNLADALDRVDAGGTVRVFDGEYEIDVPVVVDRPVTIEPMGGASPLIRNVGGAIHAFFVTDVTGGTVVIRGFRFHNPSGHSSVIAREGSQALITGAHFDAGSGTAGAFATTGARLTIENSSFEGGLAGAFSALSGTDLTIRRSTFRASGIGAFQHQTGSGGTVEDVEVLECGAVRCAGVFGGGTVEILNSRFRIPLVPGPTQTPSAGVNIVVSFGSTAIITGNDFDGCGFHNCIYAGAASTAHVSDNLFSAAVPKQNPGVGLPAGENFPTVIRFEFPGAGGTISGNRVNGCSADSCVSIVHGASAVITDNTFVGDPALTTRTGIQTWSAEHYPDNQITVSGNEFRNMVTGIGIFRTQAQVTGNSISSVERGVDTHRSLIALADNTIDALDQGIAIGSGTHGQVTGNTVAPCGANGCISLFADGDGETLTVQGNTFRSVLHRRPLFVVQSRWPAGSGPLRIIGNRIEGAVAPSDLDDPNSYPADIAFQGSNWWPPGAEGVPLGAPVEFSGNRIENAAVGVRAFHGGVIEGRDNTFLTIHGEVFGAHDRGVNGLRFNDVTGYRWPFGLSGSPVDGVGHLGTLDVTCNWWGHSGGPVNVGGHIPPGGYTPWAAAPIAGTGATGC